MNSSTALYRGKSKRTDKWYYGSYLKLDKTTYCCIVLLDENEVMWLGNNTSGLCECFTHK